MAARAAGEGGAAAGARPLGATGLVVPAVGLGAGRIGEDGVSQADVDRLVGAALDAGVTLFDSARSYGASEERLGRALGGRREQAILSTKVGYGTPAIADWTPACITAGVEAALGRMQTDRLDVVHLHSCDLHTLRTSGVVEALQAAVQAGKVRVAAYSGEGEALAWAVESGAFGAVQCSVSLVDQASLPIVARAAGRGLGVLAKRPLGNAPWRHRDRPARGDEAEAWDRFAALRGEGGLAARGLPWDELFARHAAHAPGVSTILVGTASADHLVAAATAVARGPLAPDHLASINEAWARCGQEWPGRI